MDNLLALEASSFAATLRFGVCFAGQVFVADLVTVQLVANRGFATANGAGYLSDAVTFVVE